MTTTAAPRSLAALVAAALAALALALLLAQPASAQAVRPPAGAVTNAAPADGAPPPGLGAPGFPAAAAGAALNELGVASDSDLWRAAREGEAFNTQKRGAMAGVLVQSEGSAWQAMRDGPLVRVSLYVIGAVLAVLAVFYAIKGPLKMHGPLAGVKILRCTSFERFAHWLLASSFVVLAITGLLHLFGRPYIIPLVGKENFAPVMLAGKMIHNYVGFAFMLALVLVFVAWARVNLPRRCDVEWLAKGGGAFARHGEHIPAHKFNAGQKILFWLVILLGVSVSLSGIMLIFPFQFAMFSKTFGALNALGLPALGLTLPTDLAPMQEQQLAQLWHAFVAVLMIGMIIAHAYLGTIGMKGAFDAMSTGYVDRNWAREHHALWAAEVEAEMAADRAETRMRAHAAAAATPAE